MTLNQSFCIFLRDDNSNNSNNNNNNNNSNNNNSNILKINKNFIAAFLLKHMACSSTVSLKASLQFIATHSYSKLLILTN